MSYQNYLKSSHWKNLKKEYKKSKLYTRKCWCCNKRIKKSRNFHHRTYKRLGYENLTDIIPVCHYCHNEIHELVNKYSDLPMDYADASLVALAEELSTNLVFTLDRKDFGIYRIKSRRHFKIFPL